MAIKRVQILDSAVNTDKIAADTIVAADIDETAAFNWSNASGTFSGVVSNTGTARTNLIISGTATIGRLSVTDPTSFLQAGTIYVTTGGTSISFPKTFGGAPTVTITPFGTGASSATVAVTAMNSSSVTIESSSNGTVIWQATYYA